MFKTRHYAHSSPAFVQAMQKDKEIDSRKVEGNAFTRTRTGPEHGTIENCMKGKSRLWKV